MEKIDLNKIKPRMEELAKKHKLKLVLLFGSQVNGNVNKESDIDIGIMPEKKMSFAEELDCAGEFTNLLNNVDLTVLNQASPFLLKKVAENCQVIYQKSDYDFSMFEVYALNRYQDFNLIIAEAQYS